MKRTFASLALAAAAFLSTMAHGQSVPAAPTNLFAQPGDAQAVLTWNNPSDSSITSYQTRQGTGSPLTFTSWATVASSGATTVTATVTGLTNGTRYAFELRAVNANGNGTASRVSKTLATSPTTAVTISDANLRGLLETAFGVSPGATITQGDMAKLTTIGNPENNNIANLTGLNHAVNLDNAYLGGGTISNLSPLGTLATLRTLYLQTNSITDITALGTLTGLEVLALSQNSITDITALGTLTRLENLSLGENSITDITALGTLTRLDTLRLHQNSITDITVLGTLTMLEGLLLQNNRITDITALVANSGLGTGDLVILIGNPLNAASVGTHIPALRARGVTVHYDGGAVDDDTPPPPPNDPPETTGTIDAASLEAGQSVAFNGRDYFNDPDGYITGFSGSSSNPAVATAEVGDWDTLTVSGVAEGLAEVTLSATDSGGLSSSLSFMVTVGNPASLGGAGELSAFASAPEGGVVELNVSLAKPRDADVTLTWAIGIDDDPATADADASDHGGAGGDVVIPAGETAAAISIAIADDADIEPARETFVVSLTPQDGLGFGVATATVHIEEGVCDRTPQVADELRGSRDCAAVTSAELERRVSIRLEDAGLAELRPLDLLGMAGLTALFLDGNGLSNLPEGLLSGSPGLRLLHLRGNRFDAFPTLQGLPNLVQLDMGGNFLRELPAAPFADSPNLGYLLLDGNSIETLPADLIAGLRNLRQLELQGNAVETLPDGFFNGFDRLYQLKLHDNPGAPFTVAVELAADDATDGEDGEDAETAASIRLSVPQGAPFDMSVPLTVAGGTIAAETATIAAGRMMGAPIEVLQGEDAGAVTVSIGGAPMFPPATCGFLDESPCFRGIELQLGEPVTLFEEPAAIIVPTLRR